jgi:hypothetical protein
MHLSSRDKLDVLNVRYVILHMMALIFLVLCAPLFKGWTLFSKSYMNHSLRDELDLRSAIHTNLQGMGMIS